VSSASSTTFTVQGPAGTLAGTEWTPSGEAAGLPILLVHGINMSQDVWADVAPILAEAHRVITFDQRGHGSSDKAGPFTAADYAADAFAVLDARGVERAHVVGTSFGGSTAATMAAQAPERVATVASFGGALAVEGLDLDGAIAFITSVGVRDFFAAFLPQGSFAPGTDQALLDRALDAASTGRAVDTVIAVTTTALQADTTDAARAVQAPALVVTGEHDMTCPVPAGAAVAAALRTEHVVMPGRGHVVSMEDPAGVAALVLQHVAAHDA
jgi:pimeloyl-ACP methyl ester carboxylesterase